MPLVAGCSTGLAWSEIVPSVQPFVVLNNSHFTPPRLLRTIVSLVPATGVTAVQTDNSAQPTNKPATILFMIPPQPDLVFLASRPLRMYDSLPPLETSRQGFFELEFIVFDFRECLPFPTRQLSVVLQNEANGNRPWGQAPNFRFTEIIDAAASHLGLGSYNYPRREAADPS
jgi:hypothetical protein